MYTSQGIPVEKESKEGKEGEKVCNVFLPYVYYALRYRVYHIIRQNKRTFGS